MRRKATNTGRLLTISLLPVLLMLGPSVGITTAQQITAQSYSGEATVVSGTVAGVSPAISDTGPLPSSGGALHASLLTANVPSLLTAEVADATTIGQGNESASEAEVAELSLAVGGNNISAELIAAQAVAVCTPQGAVASGSSLLVGLVVNGQAIIVSGTPNQTIYLPFGQIIINEQGSGGSGILTVNALHVVISGIANVVISSAHADITCTSQPVNPPGCPGSDFVTGGGWITGTPSAAKGNFGVGGGMKNGSLWGHLEYNDHGPNGPKVHGTGVTNYAVLSPTTRQINGTAEVNGQPGSSYEVTVSDNGEPGRNDFFSIKLSNSGRNFYYAGGTLGGGNIKIHKPCE